ncbi:MAG TPA: hypothetical protein VMB79_16810 [Jatrophihabitans sp.]|nr:hypothetical protein [Jatrophihabitans sp.]
MPTAKGRPRSVQAGFVMFGVGLVFVLVTVLPFFFGDTERSLWLNLGCLLVPLGFIVAVTGAVRAGRADQRAAMRQVSGR